MRENKDSLSSVDFDDAPVLRTEEDYRARDIHLAAYVKVSAALVEPVWRMVCRLPELRPEGQLARATELLLVGLDEEDFTMIGQTLADLLRQLKVQGRRRVLKTVDELNRLAQIEQTLQGEKLDRASLQTIEGLLAEKEVPR